MHVAIDIGKSTLRVARYVGGAILDRSQRLAAQQPEADMAWLVRAVERVADGSQLDGIGLSVFGPLNTDPRSEGFGAIGRSSDPRWSGVNVPALLRRHFGVPVRFDMDARLGALSEHRLGAACGQDSFVYLSVGTGIGGAWMHQGNLLETEDPPQLGHMLVPLLEGDAFDGNCRFHGRCLQGMASGAAVRHRTGVAAAALPPDHPVWTLVAGYLARACLNLSYVYSPGCIVLGSGLSLSPGLVESTCKAFERLHGSFPESLARTSARSFIIAGRLSPDASWVGAGIACSEDLGHLLA